MSAICLTIQRSQLDGLSFALLISLAQFAHIRQDRKTVSSAIAKVARPLKVLRSRAVVYEHRLL